MNKKITKMLCGFAVTSLTAFAVVACDNESLSGPDFNSSNSSLAESSSALTESSSALAESSSSLAESSSALVESSSSEVLPSSSSAGVCANITTTKCMTGCDASVTPEMEDCETGVMFVCKNGTWYTKFSKDEKYAPKCDDGLSSSSVIKPPSSSSAKVQSSSSKALETCKHISDYDGMTAQGNCVNQNGISAVDCVTGDNYQCKDNNWEKVSCLNIKPDECKPGMGGCGYRLCQPNGIKEIADCENGVIYVCNGEMWEVKKTEENQHCARGELEYCDACFEEGKFEGRYKCEGGKWRKYGMGDEICVHISDVRCEPGMVGCGACDPIYEGSRAEDCVTGFTYGCHNGFWTEVSVQPPVPCGADGTTNCVVRDLVD
ncbi:hypothetical protein [Fibrobacter succinogenes]|uniref:hypothetical protein n=1 Tax=Fibrobacter succinogenes TaxID=833 RepID=UPI00156948D9|nr:hypothetical protein [Fibrobacter succinogenes]